VRQRVNDHAVRTVIIDSLNGYQQAMPDEQSLFLHMHELLQFLNRSGIATFLTVAQHGLVGDMKTPVDVTYLADAVILLRFFEVSGRVRRAISVIKKRTARMKIPFASLKSVAAASRLAHPFATFTAFCAEYPLTPARRCLR
jgi:circadian clock protein KaiC